MVRFTQSCRDSSLKEFGSPSKNGLGHQRTATTHPVSRQQTPAVFVPKLKSSQWQGELSLTQSVATEAIVDDDIQALRKNQLLLD